MNLLVNIDLPDLARAITFYGDAFELTVTHPAIRQRRRGAEWLAPAALISGEVRRFARRWRQSAPALLRALLDGATRRGGRRPRRRDGVPSLPVPRPRR